MQRNRCRIRLEGTCLGDDSTAEKINEWMRYYKYSQSVTVKAERPFGLKTATVTIECDTTSDFIKEEYSYQFLLRFVENLHLLMNEPIFKECEILIDYYKGVKRE